MNIHNTGKISITFVLIVSLVFGIWFYVGWPQIWQKPAIPPEVQKAQAATATYDFSICGTDCDTSADWWASQDDVDVFPFAGNTANRNDHVENTDAQYSAIASSNDTRHLTDDPSAQDEIFYWLEMKISEATSTISQLSFTFEGYEANASDFKIYVKKAGAAYEIDASWVLLGTQNIAAGTETTITFATSTNISDYIESTGKITWGVYQVDSTDAVNVDYVKMDVTYTPTFEQSAYRLFNNLDSTDVGTALAAQDTAATLGSTGAAFRLRMLLHIGANQLDVSGQTFKLQFAQQSGTCDTGFVDETYADVTAATVIAYNDNATPADDAALTANANDPTHGTDTIVNQTYEELNNFTNSQAAIPSGQDGKWDFSLKDNGATANTAYCLRAVKSDDTVLNTYTVIPEITTAAAAAATVSCSTNISSTSFGTWTDTSVKTSSPNASTTMSCSGTTSGCALYVKDAGNTASSGLATTSPASLIPSPNAAADASTTLVAGTEGYGIQATTTSAGLTIDSRYDQTGDIVGGLSLTDIIIASSTADITDAEVIVTHMAAISEATPPGIYEDTITYSCLVND